MTETKTITTRYERGQIVAETREIRNIPQSCLVKVESQFTRGKFYNVILRKDEEGISCDCPDYEQRHELCKHCYAVIISQQQGVKVMA